MGKTVEIPIQGMDCAECVQHVQKVIQPLPGVHKVEVYLATEKAVVELDIEGSDLYAIQRAVENAGYQVGGAYPDRQSTSQSSEYTRPILTLFGGINGDLSHVVP